MKKQRIRIDQFTNGSQGNIVTLGYIDRVVTPKMSWVPNDGWQCASPTVRRRLVRIVSVGGVDYEPSVEGGEYIVKLRSLDPVPSGLKAE